MRIWSIHSKYLGTKGLVAAWREGLLAKHVLENKTKGYKNHPQLIRFKNCLNPIEAINRYLSFVYNEAIVRGYNYNRDKINWEFKPQTITVSKGQLEFEKQHLLKKLQVRDINKYNELLTDITLKPHPLFSVVKGEIEEWERIK
jgi:hypothetical protein